MPAPPGPELVVAEAVLAAVRAGQREHGVRPARDSNQPERRRNLITAAALEAGSKVTNANKQLRLVTANVARNAELRGRLLSGAARPADVARATAEELAPDAVRVRKLQRGAQQLQAEVAAAREHEQLAEEVAKSRRLELAGADRRLAAADDPSS